MLNKKINKKILHFNKGKKSKGLRSVGINDTLMKHFLLFISTYLYSLNRWLIEMNFNFNQLLC